MGSEGRPTSVTKVLSDNDLGRTNSHQAGITVPRPAVPFFPTLDERAYNPDCHVPVYCPQTGEHHVLRFIYYNNRLHKAGTRNEYRLTGTTALLRSLDADPGDLLTFRRNRLGDIEMTVQPQTPAVAAVVSGQEPILLKNGWRMTIE